MHAWKCQQIRSDSAHYSPFHYALLYRALRVLSQENTKPKLKKPLIRTVYNLAFHYAVWPYIFQYTLHVLFRARLQYLS